MNKSDIQLYTVIGNKIHEIDTVEIDKANWSALVTCKYTKPFFAWDGMNEVYDWKAGGWVSLSDIYWFDPEILALRVIPIEENRRLSLGNPFAVHIPNVAYESGL